MILKSQLITVGDTQITNVMMNIIDERQIRLKLTVDGEAYDFFIRNWYAEMKGLSVNLVIYGLEVPSRLPVQISIRYDVMKKGITISGKFLKKVLAVKTSVGEVFQEFIKLLRK